MIKSNVVEAIIGTLVLLVAGFFLKIAYQASSAMSQTGIILHAKFDRVDGLVMGNDVKVSGVKVGQIFNISLDPKTLFPIASFMVQKNLPIPKDSSAEITSEGLMGGKYIAIIPGGSKESLVNEGTITHTQSALSLEALMGKYLFNAGKEGEKNPSS